MNDVSVPGYAELHALSNFTFLRGASHPEELVRRAQALGYTALALTDECSVAGVVRAHVAAKECGLKLIVGSEFRLDDGMQLVLLAPEREAYGDLCELITLARRRAKKGRYAVTREDMARYGGRCLVLWVPGGGAGPYLVREESEIEQTDWVADVFPARAWIAVRRLCDGRDRTRLQRARLLARSSGLPLVAAGGVLMHMRQRRLLQDTLTAIRLGVSLPAAGYVLQANGERHLRTRKVLARWFPCELLSESLRIAACCQFSLDELHYEYPDELVPSGETPAAWLRQLTETGMRARWPKGVPGKVRGLVEHELALITEMHYEPYFLTVHDIVGFARSRGILCQGRGSAANSAVCFCLGITEVDPGRIETLFERFISRERNEPPDIDVDFEHERREEVIQYLYAKYGRERAALAATVISYRPKSAIRDVGKALGLALDQVDRLAHGQMWWDGRDLSDTQLREAGFDADNPLLRRLRYLVNRLIGFPRHLSQHVGGFVISQGPLSRMVPIENAAMDGRTVIEWDKDDLDALGLLKVDVLALGMLSAIRRAFDLVAGYSGCHWSMASIPAEDPAVYHMIQQADTVGVFQIESRAQMAMLPRLKPACFYDLVIEVAIVRPGPIQGDMVHPYLRRRRGLEPVSYPSEAVRSVLERTLGVPIFQEQVIKLAMVAAGFSAGEADQLRRAMAAWRRRGGLEPFKQRLIEGMRARGYPEQFACQIYQQLLGFGEYGFPESHAASFALLVYVSAWLKCHEPAAFTCALLNSQPMGFYAPAQLVQDARRHGVEVRPVDVNASGWECCLESPHPLPLRGWEEGGVRIAEKKQPALRLGLRMVKGLSQAAAQCLIEARTIAKFSGVEDLAHRAALHRGDLEALAAAGALKNLEGHRHRARWACAGVEKSLPLLAQVPIAESISLLRAPTEGQDIIADYASLGLTLGRHPLALLRERLAAMNLRTARQLRDLAHGAQAYTAGLVTCRQCPSSGAGVIFVTLEDETGTSQVVVWSNLAERQRAPLLNARLLAVFGEVQREGEVLHLLARRLEDHSMLLGQLATVSRDFH
jgi:error-prone DNA polymerase